ncbi:hypothetical protein HPB51_022068 [Rhipicephalus microplus]|uniref:Myb/SANT-like DNA-binding domain-containing protein n=1 Tax=Rhipicephalus microplus TaxID=6941 RepID=A0A9J6F7M1_RHIMP|nr:hypothetical protein HPB51_022068 [Rhipicephalus microplus]
MTSSRAQRTMWTDDEITTLLALVNEKKLSDLLDSKRQKNKDIFMDLERCLKEQGLTWTWGQISTCWKNLKKCFTAERLLLCKSGGEPSKWKWFDKMSLLLGDRPIVQARDYGVDTTAEDEDIVLLCDGSEEKGDASDDLETFRLRIRLRRALCGNRTTAAIALCIVSQDTNTTIKYSWCKLRKNTKTAIAVAERQLRKQPQPTAARDESAGLEEPKRYRKTGFRLASTQSVAAITAHLNSSVRVHINSGASR